MWMQVTGILWAPVEAADEEAKGADSAETETGCLLEQRTYRPEDIKLVSAYRPYPKETMPRAATHEESPSVERRVLAHCVA